MAFREKRQAFCGHDNRLAQSPGRPSVFSGNRADDLLKILQKRLLEDYLVVHC